MDVKCSGCGAENYESARYCRKCGFQLSSSEFHEAPTRELGHERQEPPPEPRRYETFPSAPLNAGGAPRYVPPPPHPAPLVGSTGMPARVDTAPMHTTGPVKKKTNWLLVIGGIFLTFLFGLGIIVAIVANEVNDAIEQASTPGDKRVSVGPVEVTTDDDFNPDTLPDDVRPWFYDGARGTKFIRNTVGPIKTTTLIMESDDDLDEIAEFYRDRMQSIRNKSETRKDDKVILASDGTNVIIDAAGGDHGSARILVIMGGGGPGGMPDIEIPEVPEMPEMPDVNVPEPPAPPPPAPPTPTPKKK